MADAVFDTTVFVDAYELNPDAITLMDAARSGRLSATYSPVSVYELWLRNMSRSEEAFHNSALSSLQETPFGGSVAIRLAIWFRALTRPQRLRLAEDAMIAATAASLGATIYTRNPRDFTRFYTDVRAY